MQDQTKQSKNGIDKLGIGCVQFGLPYGAFNKSGQVCEDVVAAILNYALEEGIGTLDTAHAYGDSETVLGKLGAPCGFEVITKCPPLEAADDPAAALKGHAATSLSRLNTDKVHGYLLHRHEDLLRAGGDQVWAAMTELKAQGTATKIGVSVYSVDDLFAVQARYPIDIVQLPANALSSWLYDDEVLSRIQQSGVEVHVRSVFLQGFLLAEPDHLPAHLQRFALQLAAFRSTAADYGVSPLSLALGAVAQNPAIDRLIVGVESLSQIEDIVGALKTPAINTAISTEGLAHLACDDADLTDPRRWP